VTRLVASAIIREFRDADGSSVLVLANPEIERSRYRGALRATVDALIAHKDPDSRALIATLDRQLAGVVIFGHTAGADGAGRLQLVVTHPGSRRAGIASALVEASVEVLRRNGARFAAVEMPDDPELAQVMALLARCGFSVDARVRDFYRDGVDLALFRRSLIEG